MMKYKKIVLESGIEIAIVVNHIESLHLFYNGTKLKIQMRSGAVHTVPNKNNWKLGEWCYYFEIYN